MEPLVSILIPAYNAAQTIGDTIRSAAAQSWPRKEIVVVDDGSTDGTLAEARRCASPIVRVVQQANGGGAAARNKALSVCQGDYVQWLDADDLLSVNKISSQMKSLSHGDCGPRTLASSQWGYFWHRPWRATFVPSPLWADLHPVEWTLRKYETNSHMQTATWLVSRQLSDETGPWDTRQVVDDDGEYFSRVVLRSDGIRFVLDARVYYRMSASNRVSYVGTSNAKIEAQWRSIVLQTGYLRSIRDDDRARAACTRYLEEWIWYFLPNRLDLVERATQLARSWGTDLRMPRLSWKYDWIRRSFGWSAAKQVQLRYNESKCRVLRKCDQALLKVQGAGVDVSRL